MDKEGVYSNLRSAVIGMKKNNSYIHLLQFLEFEKEKIINDVITHIGGMSKEDLEKEKATIDVYERLYHLFSKISNR